MDTFFMQTRLAILCHQSDTVATPNGNRLKSEALKKRKTTMKTLKSSQYTLCIDGSNVILVDNHSRLPQSLSNLIISTHDILFYMATQAMSNDEKADRLKQLIIGTHDDNLDRLNKITYQDFKTA